MYKDIYTKDDCSGLFVVLQDLGIYDKVLGVTPEIIPRGPRANEIRQWLSEHTDVVNFGILDDDVDAGFGFEDKFFRTSMTLGLTSEIADQVIAHLNG